ncbi:FecR family protein [Sphingobacterium sp. SGG-5]|uniref:FecR family protein n=1 Tax=Sphingobacterium sp. SGG-5 TaxID=2710881 RepID=UPI0013EC9499|nr:FecR family protein [Sphingobacterium sp. SGG-5]NGM60549.1 FecR family protein [Sphingobacterium sp. SGG-5]
MSLKTDNIANIIVKHIQGKCTAEEIDALTRWSKADPRNEALLNGLLDTTDIEQKLMVWNAFNEDKAWQQVSSHSSPIYPIRRTSRRLRWIAVVASVLLLLVAGLIIYTNRLNSADKTMPRIVASTHPKYKNDILPAVEGATLLLASGEKVALSSEITIEDNGHVLNQDNDKIADLSRSEEVVYHELIVPQTHFFTFKLPDGTKVWVNANSKLRFPSRFLGDTRHIQLEEGEAYFEVERNEKQPFIVETSEAKIKVLGTRFNVKNYQHGFVTTLAEGSVEVYNDHSRQKIRPRQKAFMRGEELVVREADLKKDLAWKNNIFYFRNDNLKNVMQQIENWYGVQVVVNKSLINSTTYSGEIERDVPLSEILNMLEFTSGLNFSLEGTKLYIKPKK